MKSGLTISAVGHALFFAWGIISFSVTPLKTEPTESLPVDIISANDFSAMTSGVKNAQKVETPKPVVEKVAPKDEIKDTTPKVVEKKPEIDNSAEAPPPMPAPKPKVAEAKPPEPKPPEVKPEKLEKKPDPIAEALKQEKPEEKKPEKEVAEQKPVQEVPTPQKRPPRPEAKPEPKFDATKVAALLDKRAPQREASAGDVINTQQSLGTPRGAAAQLSQTELDALRARLRDCWLPPAGVSNAEDLQIVTTISFRQDGTLSSDPKVSNRSSHPAFRVASESVLRAIRRCAPYTFLPAAKYAAWKDVEVTFSPKDLF